MQISPEALLQANATVIAGVLILLTLTFFGIGFSEMENRFYTYYYAAFIIIPFAVSSGLILFYRQGLHMLYAAAIQTSIFGYVLLAFSHLYLYIIIFSINASLTILLFLRNLFLDTSRPIFCKKKLNTCTFLLKVTNQYYVK